MIALLKELAGAYGPSGREEEIRSLIQKNITPYVDEVYTDAIGNLIAVKKGPGKPGPFYCASGWTFLLRTDRAGTEDRAADPHMRGAHGDGADVRDELGVVAAGHVAELQQPVERVLGGGQEAVEARGRVVDGARLARGGGGSRVHGPMLGVGGARRRP